MRKNIEFLSEAEGCSSQPLKLTTVWNSVLPFSFEECPTVLQSHASPSHSLSALFPHSFVANIFLCFIIKDVCCYTHQLQRLTRVSTRLTHTDMFSCQRDLSQPFGNHRLNTRKWNYLLFTSLPSYRLEASLLQTLRKIETDQHANTWLNELAGVTYWSGNLFCVHKYQMYFPSNIHHYYITQPISTTPSQVMLWK